MAVLRGNRTRDTILAYAVELTGTEQEKIKGIFMNWIICSISGK